MLLNELLKEHLKVEEQDARLAMQRTIIGKQEKEFTVKLSEQQKAFETKLAQRQKQIEALTMGLRKVSERVELSKSASQVADNEEYLCLEVNYCSTPRHPRLILTFF